MSLSLSQPLKDLASSWDIDISNELTDYLHTIEILHNSPDGEINFAEAGMILQQTTSLFVSKVDLLQKLFLSTLQTLSLNIGSDGSSQKNKRYGHGKKTKAMEEFEMRKEKFLPLENCIPLANNIHINKCKSQNQEKNHSVLKEQCPVELRFNHGLHGGNTNDDRSSFLLLSSNMHQSGALMYDASKQFSDRLDKMYNIECQRRKSLKSSLDGIIDLSSLLPSNEVLQQSLNISLSLNASAPRIEVARNIVGDENLLSALGVNDLRDSVSQTNHEFNRASIDFEFDNDDNFGGDEDAFSFSDNNDVVNMENDHRSVSVDLQLPGDLSGHNMGSISSVSGTHIDEEFDFQLDPTIWAQLDPYDDLSSSLDARLKPNPLKIQRSKYLRKHNKQFALEYKPKPITTLVAIGERCSESESLFRKLKRQVCSKTTLLLCPNMNEFLKRKLKLDKKKQMLGLTTNPQDSGAPKQIFVAPLQDNHVNVDLEDYDDYDDGCYSNDGSSEDMGQQNHSQPISNIPGQVLLDGKAACDSSSDAFERLYDDTCQNDEIFYPYNNDEENPTVNQVPTEFPTLSKFESPMTYVEMVRKHVERYLEKARRWTKQSNVNTIVREWQDKLEPLLQEQEEHPEFDIVLYGSRVAKSLKDHYSENKAHCETFSEVLAGITSLSLENGNPHDDQGASEQYQVCRLFLSTLQLANNRAVELNHETNFSDLYLRPLDLGKTAIETALEDDEPLIRKTNHRKKIRKSD